MAKAPRTRSRNTELARGINALSRSENVKASGRWKFRGKGGAKKTTEVKAVKAARWYDADDTPVPRNSRKSNAKPCKLRATITPGTVLILLSGRFRGKRVVFLKQLGSGTLLVTGPYKVNGVPLRRVNQAYVIATSTKLDIGDLKMPEICDKYFARVEEKKTGDEEKFFATSKAAIVSDQRKADQKAVDAQLLPKIEAVPLLKQYLNAKFALKNGDAPHAMKF